MKFLVVFFSSLVAVFSAPAIIHQPIVYTAVPSLSQWHSQDTLGQYSYGYQNDLSAKTEVKTLDGITQGSYSYIDANNQLQTVNYVSDALGFRAAATNLPQPPIDNGVTPEPIEDTIEVKSARAEHLEAVKKAQNGDATEVVALEAPEPVEDTEEVKAARAEHLKAVEEAKVRNSEAKDDSETVVIPQTISSVHTAQILSPLQTIPIAPQTVVVKSQPHVAAIQLAAPIVLKTIQPQTAFAYSVYQNAGIPHVYTV
ncbi:hypothetical protein PVAND_009028 [Polypedilum vanderplanki]|uniref:Cuticle protein 6 n=1 Tax=Polypedilum vanderplanki TaxID=319348 RepID=A0A9J6CBU1_POLVA|nr:hypothetical protein PVAND_009028 [Polypedilum vanderplanki]